jgi:hypothetical protein
VSELEQPRRVSDAPLASGRDSDPQAPIEIDEVLARTQRQRWLICFWLLFLAAPVSAFLVVKLSPWVRSHIPLGIFELVPVWVQVVLTCFGCHVGAAYCLARLGAQKRSAIFSGTVQYAFFLFFVYLTLGWLLLLIVMSVLAWGRRL